MTTAAFKINGHDLESMDPSPMDGDALAEVRQIIEQPGRLGFMNRRDLVVALYLSHEHHAKRAAELEEMVRRVSETTLGQALGVIESMKARVAMLEERCCVESEDVDREGATRPKLEAWLAQHPKWTRTEAISIRGSLWTREGKRPVVVGDGSEALAYAIEELAVADLRSGWELLSEIATIELPKLANN